MLQKHARDAWIKRSRRSLDTQRRLSPMGAAQLATV